jgi:hypothetical protein
MDIVSVIYQGYINGRAVFGQYHDFVMNFFRDAGIALHQERDIEFHRQSG